MADPRWGQRLCGRQPTVNSLFAGRPNQPLNAHGGNPNASFGPQSMGIPPRLGWPQSPTPGCSQSRERTRREDRAGKGARAAEEAPLPHLARR